MSQFFVTAIGTDVGKSFCCAAMLHQAPQYRAIKPVMSGYDQPQGSDAGVLLEAMGEPLNEANVAAISPFRFAAPLSPHLAAKKEGASIAPEALEHFCRAQMRAHPDLLIEGVGGVMVPITPDYLVLDWMRALKLPVILVAGTYLGAINHTLLSLRALNAAGLPLHALIVSQSEKCAGLEDFRRTIAPHLPKNAALIGLPRLASWKEAPDLLPLGL